MRKSPSLLLDTPAPLTLHLREFQRVSVTLVGCGGTGSHIASGLASLAEPLAERGIPLSLRFIDPDIVEPKNVGRQLFGFADVDRPKARVLAERLMAAYGQPVDYDIRPLDKSTVVHNRPDWLNIIIGAVDNPAARGAIAEHIDINHAYVWWLDCGNENHSGQVAIGNCAETERLKGCVSLGMIDRLPAPHLVYPDLVATPKAAKKKGNAPSCAELTAAGEQSLMVNRMAAAWALAMLHDLLIIHSLKYFAVAFDLQFGGVKSYTIDLPTLAGVTGLSEKQLQAQPVAARSRRSE